MAQVAGQEGRAAGVGLDRLVRLVHGDAEDVGEDLAPHVGLATAADQAGQIAAQAQAARAQYDMAARGARGEDKAAAEAQTRRAAGAVAEVEAAQAETQLRSPVGGEVAKVLAR